MGEDGWEKLSLLALFGSSDAFTAGLQSSPLGMEHGQAVNSGVRSELVGVLAGTGKRGAALLKAAPVKRVAFLCGGFVWERLEVRDERGLRLRGSKRHGLPAEVPEMLVALSPALAASFLSPTRLPVAQVLSQISVQFFGGKKTFSFLRICGR